MSQELLQITEANLLILYTKIKQYENVCRDNAVLDCSQLPEEDQLTSLHVEVEIEIAAVKKGKSAGVDNTSAELVQAGGETIIDILTEICCKIWRIGNWPTKGLSH